MEFDVDSMEFDTDLMKFVIDLMKFDTDLCSADDLFEGKSECTFGLPFHVVFSCNGRHRKAQSM